MLRIITPVKNSIESTEKTLYALKASKLTMPHEFIIYNDNSTPENTAILAKLCSDLDFKLINISDLTPTPSPNYLFVLQREQEICIKNSASLCIVESDVVVNINTLQQLYDGAQNNYNCGIAASVTHNEKGEINYPYEYAKNFNNAVEDNKKHCSFCCSILTNKLLNTFSFKELNPEKNWFDVTISHASLHLGLHNYLFLNIPVLHTPHQSRPWKMLKYKNPLLYYWRKFTKGFDKI